MRSCEDVYLIHFLNIALGGRKDRAINIAFLHNLTVPFRASFLWQDKLDSWPEEFLSPCACMYACRRKWGVGVWRSRPDKVLGIEWRMILDKRLDGWMNKQWLQTIWWITMALWWTTHGLRGKHTECGAGAWSAEWLSQQYLRQGWSSN